MRHHHSVAVTKSRLFDKWRTCMTLTHGSLRTPQRLHGVHKKCARNPQGVRKESAEWARSGHGVCGVHKEWARSGQGVLMKSVQSQSGVHGPFCGGIRAHSMEAPPGRHVSFLLKKEMLIRGIEPSTFGTSHATTAETTAVWPRSLFNYW
jgi:hypothetical protein